MTQAMVYFIGAGPGDPDLLTLKARHVISQANVILYTGSLVDAKVLMPARADAEIHSSQGMKLGEQIALMRTAVNKGQMVARLHTGDPSLYGATAEQMYELDRLGIPYQVIPGVSSAFAAAAALKLELTVPQGTQTVVLTRLAGHTPMPEAEALRSLAVHRASLVIFLSVGMIARVVDELYAAGYSGETPVAVVYRASWPDELIVRGTLSDIVTRVQAAEITHQALIIVSPALDRKTRQDTPRSHLYSAALDAPQRRDTTAIVALTRNGTVTGRRLQEVLSHSQLYAPARFLGKDEPPDVLPYTVSVRQVLQAAFQEHQALVCIMASGIVVRELAPLVRSKHSDPAVVVLDEQGEYAISLLGGHKGGANELARQVASSLGGTAVLTTASDVQGLPAMDLLGQEDGWVLRRQKSLTPLSAALVNGAHVGVLQEAGSESWWPQPCPANLIRYPTLANLQEASPAAALLITHRQVPKEFLQTVPDTVIYHPPCLTIGVGCNRGAAAREILAAVDRTLADARLAPQSVCCVATIRDKANEPGLVEACRSRGWPLHVFSRRQIQAAPEPPNPSTWAQRVLGVPGVAEPTAMLTAGNSHLVVEKRKFPNVTVAVAKKEEKAQ